MQVSRRAFFHMSATTATGTALGGLAGLGANLAPAIARAQELRIKNAKTIPSICPYCAVGCATLVHTVEGKIVNIEGDPRSPFSEGTLCPKGAAIYELHVNPNRPTRCSWRDAVEFATAEPEGRSNADRTMRVLLSLLPMTLTLQDHASTEKIGYPPRKLSTAGAPAGVDPSVGDIAYYAPWGNLTIFYRDFGYSRGLIGLGRIDSGVEALSPGVRRSHYLKVRDRASFEFAVVSAAVALEMDGGRIRQARVALGGVGTKPWRVLPVEAALAGASLEPAQLRRAASLAAQGAQGRGHNDFKIELMQRAIVRAVETAGARA